MLPSLAIVVLTSVVDAATQLELSKIGINFILEKKISSDQLVDTLRVVEAIKRNDKVRS
jgi:DNA-binding NarL/FixJ family response regulator